MAAKSIYKQHYNPRCSPFPLKNIQQCESRANQILSLRRTKMDLYHSKGFCGLERVWPADKDSERSICSCGHRSRKRKWLIFGKFRYQVGVAGCIC